MKSNVAGFTVSEALITLAVAGVSSARHSANRVKLGDRKSVIRPSYNERSN